MTVFFLASDNLKSSPEFGDNSLSLWDERLGTVFVQVDGEHVSPVFITDLHSCWKWPWLLSALIIGSCYSAAARAVLSICNSSAEFIVYVCGLQEAAFGNLCLSRKSLLKVQCPGSGLDGSRCCRLVRTFCPLGRSLSLFPASHWFAVFQRFGDSFMILI